MAEETKQRPWYFSLNQDGASAVVRILHTNTSTIETMTSHRVMIGGKKKRIKCIGEGCPLCAEQNTAESRIYIHLWDYTDNKEKVWERTDKIIPQLEKLQADWNPLNSAVVKITRKGNNFPKYDVVPVNPLVYSNVPADVKVDEQLAKLYAYSRKKEDIDTFIKTGTLPERKPFVSKEEYAKQHTVANAQSTQQAVTQQPTPSEVANNSNAPFIDEPFAPRKV